MKTKMNTLKKLGLLSGIIMIQSASYAADIEPISFNPTDEKVFVEAISFTNMDCRVRSGVTRKDWVDGETMPGWVARAADKPAESLQLTHGGNPTPGIQVLVDPKRHRGVALGTFNTTAVKNAMIAVVFRNDTGGSIDTVTVKIKQVQWMSGTVSQVDRSHGWWRIGDGQWQKNEELDLQNFVAGMGGLAKPIEFDREVLLGDMSWKPGETLSFRWVDTRVGGGGNAGAGIASLQLSAPNM